MPGEVEDRIRHTSPSETFHEGGFYTAEEFTEIREALRNQKQVKRGRGYSYQIELSIAAAQALATDLESFARTAGPGRGRESNPEMAAEGRLCARVATQIRTKLEKATTNTRQ